MTDTVSKLREWLDVNGIILDDAFAIKFDNADHSFSVVARKTCAPNRHVATIPKKAILSRRNVEPPSLTTSIQAVIDKLDLPVGQLVTLSLLLLREKSLGKQSRWNKYISSLPAFVPIAALWPKDTDSVRWLKGSAAGALLGRTKTNEHIEQIFHSSQAALEQVMDCAFSLDDLIWAYSIVSSRAFLVDNYHGLSLVPLADLFNHHDFHTVEFRSDHWVCDECGSFRWCEHDDTAEFDEATRTPDDQVDDDDNTCEMYTCSPILEGQEVYNSYGWQLGSAQCLVHYGFVTDKKKAEKWALRIDSTLLQDAGLTKAHIETWLKRDSRPGHIDASQDMLLYSICDFDSSIDAENKEYKLIQRGPSAHDPNDVVEMSDELLFFGPGGRMSPPLWQLFAIMSCPAGIRQKTDSKLAWAQYRLVGGEDQFISADSDDGLPNGTATSNDWVRAFAKKVLEVCAAKKATWHEPTQSSETLRKLAETEDDVVVKLAMRYAAQERALVEGIEELQKPYLDATAHLERRQKPATRGGRPQRGSAFANNLAKGFAKTSIR